MYSIGPLNQHIWVSDILKLDVRCTDHSNTEMRPHGHYFFIILKDSVSPSIYKKSFPLSTQDIIPIQLAERELKASSNDRCHEQEREIGELANN